MIDSLILLLAAQAAPASSEEARLGERAAQSFEQVCLANRNVGAEAAIAAIRAKRGVTEQPSLPLGRKTLRMFAGEQLEYLVRPEKRGFGCFVAFKGDAAQLERAVATLSAVGGLLPRKPETKGKPSFEWSLAGSADHVRLVPNSDIGGVLINFEVSGK